jgi:hypothetical protein
LFSNRLRYDGRNHFLGREAWFMSNGTSRNNSIWMGTTVIAVVIALGAIGWAAMLQKRTKKLEERVESLEAGLPKAGGKGRNVAAADSDATAASSRRKGRAATATAPGGSAPAADGTRSKP